MWWKSDMEPGEKVNQQIWEILQGIKEDILATVKGRPIKYRIPSIVGVGIIPKHRRINILYKLEEEKAFIVQRNSSGTRIGTGDIFYLIINSKEFDKVYKKYQKLNEPQINLKGKKEIKELSIDALKEAYELLGKIENIFERSTSDEPVLFHPAWGINSRGDFDDQDWVLKFKSWEILSTEINELEPGMLLYSSLSRIRKAKEFINEIRIGKSKDKHEGQQAVPLNFSVNSHHIIDLKRELSVARKIIENIPYIEGETIRLRASEFQAKHFNGLNPYEFLDKIKRILRRFESFKILSNFKEGYRAMLNTIYSFKFTGDHIDRVNSYIEKLIKEIDKREVEKQNKAIHTQSPDIDSINKRLNNLNWPLSVSENKQKYLLHYKNSFVCDFEKNQNLGEILMLFLMNANKYLTYRQLYNVTVEAKKIPYEEAIYPSKDKLHKKLRQNWYDIVNKKFPKDFKKKLKFPPEGGKAGKFKAIFCSSSVNSPE